MPLRHGTQQFDDVFHGRYNKQTLHNIFNCFADKVIGYMMASLALLNAAYLYALLQIKTADHNKALGLALGGPGEKNGKFQMDFYNFLSDGNGRIQCN